MVAGLGVGDADAAATMLRVPAASARRPVARPDGHGSQARPPKRNRRHLRPRAPLATLAYAGRPHFPKPFPGFQRGSAPLAAGGIFRPRASLATLAYAGGHISPSPFRDSKGQCPFGRRRHLPSPCAPRDPGICGRPHLPKPFPGFQRGSAPLAAGGIFLLFPLPSPPPCNDPDQGILIFRPGLSFLGSSPGLAFMMAAAVTP
jgi:hypothetical protein